MGGAEVRVEGGVARGVGGGQVGGLGRTRFSSVELKKFSFDGVSAGESAGAREGRMVLFEV